MQRYFAAVVGATRTDQGLAPMWSLKPQCKEGQGKLGADGRSVDSPSKKPEDTDWDGSAATLFVNCTGPGFLVKEEIFDEGRKRSRIISPDGELFVRSGKQQVTGRSWVISSLAGM